MFTSIPLYDNKIRGTNMTSPKLSKLHKWLGPNPGTHWTIAGSVAVIMLGGYFIYSSNRDTPVPMAPAQLTSE
jgi:hypothetical protein